MIQKNEDECCTIPDSNGGCCKVEAIIGIDERGQMVLPKEARDKANIQAGDKLAVISWEENGKVCCLSLLKADDLIEMVKDRLGPVMTEIFQK